ncbi:hypothetical protein [Gordonia shandongensis]|uniref:hypothetical protein n=1 Tax=Gordonia shandongensis TaxID=376351 RepID=UPI0012EBE252|nr:hypothetical protein [Gordonia shandongensis]
MPVSVPEKTLEHWASQYINYRFLAHASLWWPVAGEDIEIRRFPNNRIGKSIQIEVKTCTGRTAGGRNYQDVFVDIGQLCDYLRRPSYLQPVYAIPSPDWPGVLEEFAQRVNGPSVTEHAFKRSGEDDWWFAAWMRVLTTAEVGKAMSAEIAAHRTATVKAKNGAFTRGIKKKLVEYEVGDRKRKSTRWAGGYAPRVHDWRDFWTALKTCGRSDWPQVLWLPPGAAGNSYQKFADYLRGVAVDVDPVFADPGSDLLPFMVDDNGEFSAIDPDGGAETASIDPEGDLRFGAWLALGR